MTTPTIPSAADLRDVFDAMERSHALERARLMDRLHIPGGICCACGENKQLRNIVTLKKKARVPGHGWGCVACHLPNDGAIAAICDDCVESKAEIRYACNGALLSGLRVPVSLLTEPFDHTRPEGAH